MIDQLAHTEATMTFAWRWACPRCGDELDLEATGLTCPSCRSTFPCEGGIWRCLPEERAEIHRPFVDRYAMVRRREGWGSEDPAYYRALPDVPPDDPNAHIWAVRRKTFDHFVEHVLTPFEARSERPLSILDLGAGNGWIAYRMARRGHRVVAVDLSTNPSDGLGALEHYEVPMVGVQADFDRLPFAREQFDLAIFNGSLHYSWDVTATLREALRVLLPNGRTIILDSPLYRSAASGRAMAREREAHFRDDLSLEGGASNGRGFLTYDHLNECAATLGLQWAMHRPFYGWRWMARPLWHQLRGRREPATFGIIVLARGSARSRHTVADGFVGRIARTFGGNGAVPVLDPVEGYDRCAAAYGERMNPVQILEAESIERLLPEMEDLDVLDIGCGRGRLARLALSRGAASVTGVDASLRMIELARAEIRDPRVTWRQGDATQLPCKSDSVGVVVSGLMMGHVADLDAAIAEMARVLAPGGTLILSDFHPYATLSGAQRTFADVSGRTYAIRHHLHLLEDYFRCFRRHGIAVAHLEEPRHDGMPVVFIMKAEKRA